MAVAALQDELQALIERAKTDLFLHMAKFLEIVPETLKPAVARTQPDDLDPAEKQELRALTTWIRTFADQHKIRGDLPEPPSINSERVQEYVASLFFTVFLATTHRQMVAEMALVWIVAVQEGFVKDYLRALLRRRPEIMKSSKQITYEQACSFNDMSDLLYFMAEREVEDLGYKDIDEVAAYIKDRLGLEVVKLVPNWVRLREVSYRRNVVIHNRGIADRRYCQKTESGAIGDKVVPDIEYCKDALGHVWTFVETFHQLVLEKFCADKPGEEDG